MKRLVLTVMVVLSMTIANAENERVNGVEVANAYNFEVNYQSLANYLDLTADQLEAVKDIHSEFTSLMMNASGAEEAESKLIVENAIYRNLNYMRLVLTSDQYRAYLKALNATFINRGLNK